MMQGWLRFKKDKKENFFRKQKPTMKKEKAIRSL